MDKVPAFFVPHPQLNLESVSYLLIVNDMMNNNLPIEKAAAQAYVPPVCQEIFINAESMICISLNEKVEETDGEW